MAKLSERLKAMAGMFTGQVRRDVESAQSVCALVEAFQAAEQALRENPYHGDNWHAQWQADMRAFDAAKARLLEVNLD